MNIIRNGYHRIIRFDLKHLFRHFSTHCYNNILLCLTSILSTILLIFIIVMLPFVLSPIAFHYRKFFFLTLISHIKFYLHLLWKTRLLLKKLSFLRQETSSFHWTCLTVIWLQFQFIFELVSNRIHTLVQRRL